MKLSIATLVATCLAVAAASAPAQTGVDTIRTRAGQTFSGRIQAEEYEVLHIDLPKEKDKQFPWADVLSIRYSDAKAIDEAERDLDGTDPASGVSKLKSLSGDSKVRAITRQRALYSLASALYRRGEVEDGDEFAKQLRSEFPKGRYAADVVRASVYAKIGKGDAASAASLVETARKEGRQAGLPAKFDLALAALGARATEAAGKLDQAKTQYGAITSAPNVPPELLGAARLGIARCEQAAGRMTEAETAFRAVADKQTDPALLAAAWNGIGDVLLARGKEKRNETTLLDAAYAHLQGAALASSDRDDGDRRLEQCLAGAASAFEELAKISTADSDKSLYRKRADERWARLRTLFPATKLAPPAPAAPPAAPAPAPEKPNDDR